LSTTTIDDDDGGDDARKKNLCESSDLQREMWLTLPVRV